MALDRRGFLKFAIGGAVGTLFTPLPWKLADDVAIWTQNWPWIPRLPRGEVTTKYTLIKYPPYEYGAQVSIIKGNPITIAGEKNHYLSRGGAEAVGLSSVALLYSPARIKSPLLKKNGKFVPISWEEGEKILLERLNQAKTQKNGLLFISGDSTSSSSEIFSAFVSALDSCLYFFEPSDRNTYFTLWHNLFNGQGEIGFDLENADHLLVVGCNPLDSWGTPVRNQRLFGERKWSMSCISPTSNNTAVVAEKWLCVPRNKLHKVVLAIASSILSLQPRLQQVPGMEEFVSYVRNNFSPADIAKDTGLNIKEIHEEAKKLLKAKYPIVIGGSPCNGGGDRATIVGCMLLNILLGRINQKGGIRCIPRPPKVLKSAEDQKDILLKDLIKELVEQGTSGIKMALFYETNPFYSYPPAIREELKKIPYKISFSTFLDETALECDLILPSAHFLEREDDCYTPFGSGEANYSVYERVIPPFHNVRSIPDFILSVAKKMGINLNISSYKDLLKTKAEYLGVKLEELASGKVWRDNTVDTPYGLKMWNKDFETLFNNKEKEKGKYPLELVPLSISKVGTPYTGIPPLNLKVIYEDELNSKGFFVSINPATASNYHLKEGEEVELESSGGKCRALVKITKGVARGVIAAPLGFGHKGWNEFNQNKGDNIANLFYVKKEKASGGYDYSEVNVTLTKI